jgi:hypothetical protein
MAMGGVGEAMLLGAAMGGGSAMLTGGDPLKGALMGGLTGGAGAGITGALSGAAPVAAGVEGAVAPAVANAAIPTVAPSVVPPVVPPVNPIAPSAGISTLPSGLPTSTANQILGQIAPGNVVPPSAITSAAAPVASANPIPTSFDSFGNQVPINSPAFSSADPTGLAQQQLNLNNAVTQTAAPGSGKGTFLEGMNKFVQDPIASIKANPMTAIGSVLTGATGARKKPQEPEEYNGPLRRFRFNPDTYQAAYADGGIATLASGGYDRMVGEEPMYTSNMAHGGIANLGGYSDGGRMLRGPGDGMSDSIPASISGRRPARLADGEFVVPADVVSHLGNGSTDAGAKQLYAMMDKVRQARTGRKAQGREINPRQYVPA